MVFLTEVKLGGPSNVGNRFPKPFSPYPEGYNAKIHGAYDPARYYGKPKIAMWDVKLGNLGQHLVQADKSPQNIFETIGRFGHRYAQRHFRPQKTSVAPFFQLWALVALTSFCVQFQGYKNERRFKYHW